MQEIVSAICEAANFAALVNLESKDLQHQLAAERVLAKLHRATDRLIEIRGGGKPEVVAPRQRELTGCGIDMLMVVCHYPITKECFYPSGPCAAGRDRKTRGALNEECTGKPQYCPQRPIRPHKKETS